MPADEAEAGSQFEQEGFHLAQDGGLEVAFGPGVAQAQEVQHIRVAQQQRGAHALGVAQRGQFLLDLGLGLL